MSNIQNINIRLHEITKNIRKNIYLIPRFQRDFVWKSAAISDLGDSIIRGYPISSLLIIPTNGALKNIGVQKTLINNSSHDNKIDNEQYYILDGQQRLTAIAILFLGKDKKDEYYFDLLALLLEKFPKDNILNIPSVKITSKNHRIKTEEDMEICRSFEISTTKDKQATRYGYRFVSGETILKGEYSAVIDDFFDCWFDGFKKDNKNDYVKYKNYVTSILGIIGEYQIPAIKIDRESELGVVIRVFEKVNTTGKKLTLFDIINAQSFDEKQYVDGLSGYLTEQIKSSIADNNYLKKGIDTFLEFDIKEEKFANLARITRIFEITHLLRIGSVPSIFKTNMLERGADFWFNFWNDKGRSLLDAIQWLDDEKLLDVGGFSFLEYAIAIFLAKPENFCNAEFKKNIKKYALYLPLSEHGNFNKSNLDIVKKLYDSEFPKISSFDTQKIEALLKKSKRETSYIKKSIDIILHNSKQSTVKEPAQIAEIINLYFLNS